MRGPGRNESFVPDEGDVVEMDFGPVQGHEQDGVRPAIVLSPKALNGSGIGIFVPMTTRVSGARTELPILSFNPERKGVALITQLTCLDWRARKAEFRGRLSRDELLKVRYYARLMLGALPAGYRPPSI